jgi:hypothetical protein
MDKRMNDKTKKHIKDQIIESIRQQNRSDARYLQTYKNHLQEAASIRTLASCDQIPILRLNKTAFNSTAIDESGSAQTAAAEKLRSPSSSGPQDVHSLPLSSPSITMTKSMRSATSSSLKQHPDILHSYHFIAELSIHQALSSCIRHLDTDLQTKHDKSQDMSENRLLGKAGSISLALRHVPDMVTLADCRSLDMLLTSTRISLAVELLEAVLRPREHQTSLPDPSRIYFKAGFLFDSVNLSERSIHSYEQALRHATTAYLNKSTIQHIVESYDMKFDTPEYQRKIERASKLRVHQIIKKRESMLQGLLDQETERQRLIILCSSLLLLRLHLNKASHEKAYSMITSLLAHLNQDILSTERRDVFIAVHDMLKASSLTKPSEWSPQLQVLRNSSGPLAETHLKILLELETVCEDLVCKGIPPIVYI